MILLSQSLMSLFYILVVCWPHVFHVLPCAVWLWSATAVTVGLVHPELVPSSRGTSCNTHGDIREPCSRNGGGNPGVQPQHQMPTSGGGDAFLRVTEGPG